MVEWRTASGELGIIKKIYHHKELKKINTKNIVMSLTELAVKRPSFIVVIFTILTLIGIISYSSLNYELLPKITSPVVTVTTVYPGASPSEVESSVTKKIEDEVSSIEKVDKIQSTSLEGVSIVVVTLKYNADVDQSLQSAQRKVNAIRSQLPEGVKEPALGKFSLDEMPIMKIGATSTLTPTEFTDVLENKIIPDLSRVEGVATVDLTGNEKREIKVNVNSDKLNTYNLSIMQITQALSAANLDFPTGKVKNETSQLQVRLSGKLQSVDDLRNLVISTTQGGSSVYLKDVAEVVDASNELTTISRLNGRTSVGISVTKQTDGNAVEVSKLVKKKLDGITNEYQKANLKFEMASDTSVFTLEAANGVIHDLVLAIILVAVIMLLFLHSPRNAFIVMVSIPLSIIATFIVMYALGYSLNLMTLLALSLVVGILVDDSIVVLENIYSHMEKGATAKEASIKAWKEIGISVASITLVIIVVFLPITFVTGLVADLLRQFSVVVAVATLISLFVSFTVTPLLASRFSKLTHLNRKKLINQPLVWFEKGEEALYSFYRKLLCWSLNHKRWVLGGIFVMIVASFGLLGGGFIGSEFTSSGDNGEFSVEAKLSKDATLEQSNQVAYTIENYLRRHKEVVSLFTIVGSASGGGMGSSQGSPNVLTTNVKLVAAEERKQSSAEYAALIKRELFLAMPGIELKATPVGMMGSSGAPIQVIIKGNDLDSILAYGEQIKQLVKSVPGIVEISSSVESGNPELGISIDRKKMSGLGLNMNIVGATLQNSFAGNTGNKFKDGQNEYDINVRLDAFDRRSKEDLANILFMSNNGELVKLTQFAEITPGSGPTKLEREDKITSVTIGARVVGRPAGSVGTEIQGKLKELKPPSGVAVSMGGDLERQTESFASLGMALLMSIILVYLIMVALYDSYVYPFVVMFSIPVAIIGAFLALAINMQNMSIFSMLGLIMLVGLVVKNAILIVDFINQIKSKARSLKDAVIDGTMSRFRPILMTTIAMVIAMIPIAIAKGAGSEWKNGLAWVLIGGLTSSMFLTLLIVPIMYYLVDRVKEKFGKKKKLEEVTADTLVAG
jgi:hydrophobic/amphiphilic exporter-1 (mainly G- bacteria), HAE1 family